MYAKGKLFATLLALGLSTASTTPAPAESPAPAPADMKPFTQQIPDSTVNFDMLPIPGGKFALGTPDAEPKREDDEGPQVEVEVEPFYMGKYEVTQAEYDLFTNRYSEIQLKKGARAPIPDDKLADAITYPTPMYTMEAGPIMQRMGQGGKYPAVIMSHYAARQYTKWLSKKSGRFYRLPTEAEWEYACRAGTKTAYSFGDDPKQLKDYGWFVDSSELKDGEPAYHPVGEKKPNPWGLYDMHGNVAELVIDQYAKNWYETLKAKPQPVKLADTISWPTKQYPRVARGGGYESEPEACRSGSRNVLKSAGTINVKDPQEPKSPFWYSDGFWVGLRVVSPVKEPSEAEKKKFWDELDPGTANVVRQKEDRAVRELVTPGPEKK